MNCCRCGRAWRDYGEFFWWFSRKPGWTTTWCKGDFWMCERCLNELIGWWLELTHTMGSPDPLDQPRKKK